MSLMVLSQFSMAVPLNFCFHNNCYSMFSAPVRLSGRRGLFYREFIPMGVALSIPEW